MTLKKLPLAIAIAAALAAPTAMAQSSVTVYGKLYPHVISESGSGATAGTTTAASFGANPAGGVNAVQRNNGMTSGNSRWGIRGKEDLGGGLKAMFQMESVIAVENGQAGGSSGFWSRNTFVGLESKMGTLKLGLMDTIFKEYGDTIGTLGVSSGTFLSSSNILRKPGFGTSSNARFHERMANSIQYESPEISGFQAGLQYSNDALKVTARGKTPALSMGLKYDKGPWYFAIAHEIHDDFFGGSAQARSSVRNLNTDLTLGSKDKATQFTIEWRMNKQHKFGFDVIQKDYSESGATVAGRFKSYENTAIQVAMENRWSDKFRTAAHYVKSNAGSCTRVSGTACSTSGLEGSQLTAAASYYLSRRTHGFVGVSRITNGASAKFTTTQLGTNTNPGEDLTQVGIGLAHSF